MYCAATNLMQNQVLVPLTHLLSQSSALVGSRPVVSGLRTTSTFKDSFGKKRVISKDNLKPVDGDTAVSKSSAHCSNVNDLSIFTASESVVFLHTQEQITNRTLKKAAGTSSKVCSDEVVSLFSKLVNNSLDKMCSEKVIQLYSSKFLHGSPALHAARQLMPSQLLQGVEGVSEHILRSSKPESVWRVSHVSSSSFHLNKCSPNLPAAATPQLAPLAVGLHKALFAQLRTNTSTPLYNVRNFKTMRSIERETARRASVRDRLRAKISPLSAVGTDASSNAKLKALMAESPKYAKNQISVAFAEGYLAANGGSKSNSRIMKFVKNFQHVIGLVASLALLAVIWNASGTSMLRMNGKNANEVLPEDIAVSFDDVRGVDEAKEELLEIVEFLRCPDKFTALGAELPKGVLLVGPPGTGKTLLARAVAGEAGVPFFQVAGPEFDEILVGQGARRVRDLFKAAKARAPCVIFIDEIDSVGAKRSSSALHPYANQTINQLLAEMDGFDQNEGVIVLGATNRRHDLDKALMRPGRFDVEVHVPIPDLAGRKDIFNYYLARVKTAEDVAVDLLARGTTRFTGADIKNVVNQAALRAASDLLDSVSMKHFEIARDKVLMGPEKKSRIPDEEVNLVTAYHEGGHTVVSHFTKYSYPLHKVTIIPRGQTLGHTAYIPAKEEYSLTRVQMLARLDSLMGGRAAEELVFGAEMVTSGAASDLKHATNIATMMVKNFGMSHRVGLRTFEANSDRLTATEVLSDSTTEAIDAEIKKLLQESYERACTILRTYAKEHKALAEALMKYETLDADDIKAILDGQAMTKDA